MSITKSTLPQCLYVAWDEQGNLKGAAFYEQTIVRDGEQILSVTQGDAQPVAILGQKGIDIAGVIGRVGQDALILAEAKTFDLALAKAELDEQKARADAASAERDSLKTELDELRKQRAKPPAAEVTRLQAKMALMSAGLLSQVEEFVSQADDMTKLAWNEASVFRRDSAVLVTLASSVGMTEQQLDELFALASTISV